MSSALAGFFLRARRPAGNQQTDMVNKREKNEGAKKVAATTAPKGRVASKPKVATRTADAAPAAKTAKKKTVKQPTIRTEDIALRAYFIAEKRQQLGLPGDSMSDWVEAERQLLGERGTHGVN
jgi:hypothetical protein